MFAAAPPRSQIAAVRFSPPPGRNIDSRLARASEPATGQNAWSASAGQALEELKKTAGDVGSLSCRVVAFNDLDIRGSKGPRSFAFLQALRGLTCPFKGEVAEHLACTVQTTC